MVSLKSSIAFIAILGSTFAYNHLALFSERKLNNGHDVVCEFSGGTFTGFHTLGEAELHQFAQIAGGVLSDASFLQSDTATIHVYDQVMEPVKVPVVTKNPPQEWDYHFDGLYGSQFGCDDCHDDNDDGNDDNDRRLNGVAQMLRERLVDQMPFFVELNCARIKCGDFLEDVNGEGCPLLDPVIPEGNVNASSSSNSNDLVTTAAGFVSLVVAALCI
mmetsp:Transcript_1404/g.1879  ORF Transcript_1404/g.1879 Transcript_1404/m.1879 type:complete len:217 (+) Transcript_1404:388-1038(+)|eukprot:CAMPEP_0178915440 /NCGR_PEP_ID=MMETSP0786-20121207/12029_1 /TAXON_ID=186022 /ORGANISM="Thalassionema frauenfeldii, Strain CCMP 1798" /LENGTH=216 /DNA_ID=CAMNT_0020588553 /DNA_START=193 /DNA_END=843 /DNA_ORIENTATION=-